MRYVRGRPCPEGQTFTSLRNLQLLALFKFFFFTLPFSSELLTQSGP